MGGEGTFTNNQPVLLAIDVGNTNIVLGLFDGERLTADWRLSTKWDRTSDEIGIELMQLFQARGIENGAIDHVVVRSPDPDRTVAAFARAGIRHRRRRQSQPGAAAQQRDDATGQDDPAQCPAQPSGRPEG